MTSDMHTNTTEDCLADAERKLRSQARAFAHSLAGGRMAAHNWRSLMRSLIGYDVGKAPSPLQGKEEAAQLRKRLSAALARERRRSRTMSGDYDLNRHIALHQAIKMLAAGGNLQHPQPPPDGGGSELA